MAHLVPLRYLASYDQMKDQMKEAHRDACMCEFTAFSVPEGVAQCGDMFLIPPQSPLIQKKKAQELLYHILFFLFYTISDSHPFKNLPHRGSQPSEFQGFFLNNHS